MTANTDVSVETIARDFRHAMHGKLDEENIDAAVRAMRASARQEHRAHADVRADEADNVVAAAEQAATAAGKAVTAEQAATAAGKYYATGSVASFIFYLRFQVGIPGPGGRSFIGNAGGLASPGAGALFGHVYTDDLGRLYRDTVAFSFFTNALYTTLQFWDKDSKYLGSYHAGAVTIVSGTGGGTGSWT